MFSQKTRSWKGYQNLHYLIIFGDSYSDVGYSSWDMSHPDETEPLGIPFPGDKYANGPNWVGHLVSSYNRDQSPNQLLVFNYASGGEQTRDLNYHLEYQFLPQIGDQPHFAPWDKYNSLFITWIGINDVGNNDGDRLNVESAITRIFELQKNLYETGARNFMFIDIPPIHRSPAVLEFGESDKFKPYYENWNSALGSALLQFASSYPEATTFIFSSWGTFTRILDDPTGHGFKTSDPTTSGGGIWLDDLHPTSAVHKILAEDVAKFLESQDPTV